ncbi:hypothetical protein O3P69_017204 [Scylla paramamosain]|uniref:Uncharacterized protein n=1 Tax=Scylla paramamosain TaxID=85552 RepID=A0AAW0TXT6_SCYPA
MLNNQASILVQDLVSHVTKVSPGTPDRRLTVGLDSLYRPDAVLPYLVGRVVVVASVRAVCILRVAQEGNLYVHTQH